jgi:hypothetical protein
LITAVVLFSGAGAEVMSTLKPVAFWMAELAFAIAEAGLAWLAALSAGDAGLGINTAAAALVKGVTPTLPVVGTDGEINKSVLVAPKGSRAQWLRYTQ